MAGDPGRIAVRLITFRLPGIQERADNRGVTLGFRNATCTDESFLWDMLYLALYVQPGDPPLPRSILREPAIARYVRDWGTRPGDQGLIAVEAGISIGAAWLRFFPASDPGYGYVSEAIPELSIAVLPDCRGKGIGSQLLDSLLDGVPTVSLSCDPKNPAWKLYRRFGFTAQPDGRTMLRIG